MIEKNIRVLQDIGMRNGTVVRFVEVANQFSSEIWLKCGHYRLNAKSLLGIMNLCPKAGIDVTLLASGEDEERAVNALEHILVDYTN